MADHTLHDMLGIIFCEVSARISLGREVKEVQYIT